MAESIEVASAHPVPEAEHVGGVDAEFRNRFVVGRDGCEVFGMMSASRCPGGEEPVRALSTCVGHGLERG